jgi:hypothetical protein
VLLAGCDAGAAGRRAYREGRFEDAHAALVTAVESAGEDASAELLYSRGLAALATGDLRDADSSAERAASRGDPEIAALCDFLRGNAAFGQCELAERQASTVEAEPFAFDIAIRFGEKARDFWQLAAASRPDWPEARRNVERALLKLEELAKKKAEAQKDPERPAEPRPLPLPESADEGRKTEEEAAPEAQLTELTAEQVEKLLQRLAEKEAEKVALRRSHRRKRMEEVEKDW